MNKLLSIKFITFLFFITILNVLNVYTQTDTVKYSIKMSLQKSIYKLYEPVIAKFELINYDSKELDMYDNDLFDPDLSDCRINISDNLGNQWHERACHFDILDFLPPQPDFIIKPKDTMVISMAINNWGEKITNDSINRTVSSGQYGYCGYFQPGRKYRAFFYASEWNGQRTKSQLTSNEVNFEIIAADEEDNKLMNLYNSIWTEPKRDTLFSLYKNKPYAEWKISRELYSKYWSYKSDFIPLMQDTLPYGKRFKNLLKDYKTFFTVYPDSYLMYDYTFMRPFFFKLFSGRNDYNNILRYIRNEFDNPQLSVFLGNDVTINWIKYKVNGQPWRVNKQWIIINPIDH